MTHALARTETERLQVRSRFADVEVDPRDVVTFPDGLPGYEGERQFVLLDAPETAPLRLLHAVNGSDPCFLVVDPKRARGLPLRDQRGGSRNSRRQRRRRAHLARDRQRAGWRRSHGQPAGADRHQPRKKDRPSGDAAQLHLPAPPRDHPPNKRSSKQQVAGAPPTLRFHVEPHALRASTS